MDLLLLQSSNGIDGAHREGRREGGGNQDGHNIQRTKHGLSNIVLKGRGGKEERKGGEERRGKRGGEGREGESRGGGEEERGGENRRGGEGRRGERGGEGEEGDGREGS